MRIVEAQVFVTDLAEAEQFYSHILGFDLASKGDQWLIYNVGIELVVMAGAGSRKATTIYGASADTVICLEVQDIAECVSRLESQQVQFLSPIQEVPQGKFAAFSDPDGNLFELVQRRV